MAKCDIGASMAALEVAPANPAQVTDAVAICRTVAEEMIATNQQWRLDPRYIIILCDALTAAIGAGGQAIDQELRDAAKAMSAEVARNVPVVGAGGQAVAVKPLEWSLFEDNWWTADTIIGGYEVRQGSASARIRFPSKTRFEEFAGTIEAAKAAAQADYERRILSALSQPHPADERVVEAASAVLKWLDGGCSSWGVPEQQIRILALSAKEGRNHG